MTSPLLGLADLPVNADGNELVVNEGWRRLEVFSTRIVLDRDLTAPPGSPSEGDAYIVAAGGTGDWATRDNDVTWYQGGEWKFFTPSTAGPRLYLVDEATDVLWNGAAWVSIAGAAQPLSPTAGSVSWDASISPFASMVMTDDVTLQMPTHMAPGARYFLYVEQGNPHTLSFAPGYLFADGNPPNLSNQVGRKDLLTFISTGTEMLLIAFIKNLQ